MYPMLDTKLSSYRTIPSNSNNDDVASFGDDDGDGDVFVDDGPLVRNVRRWLAIGIPTYPAIIG